MKAEAILAPAATLPQPMLLVGHSSGAVAAPDATLRDPTPFSGLVLFEPPLPARSTVGGKAVDLAWIAVRAGDKVEAVRIFGLDVVGLPATVIDDLVGNPKLGGDGRPYRGTAGGLRGHRRARRRRRPLRALMLPVTLLVGELSPAHLRERSADVAAVLPDVRVVRLPGQGHAAHLDAPALMAATIRAAL